MPDDDENANRVFSDDDIKRGYKAVYGSFSGIEFFFTFRLPLILVALIGMAGGVAIMARLNQSLELSNASLVIVATLSALHFSAARAVRNEKVSDGFTFAGERLLHAVLYLVICSAILFGGRYFALVPYIGDIWWLARIIAVFVGYAAGLAYLAALLDVHSALRISYRILWGRLSRYPGWDKYW